MYGNILFDGAAHLRQRKAGHEILMLDKEIKLDNNTKNNYIW